MAKNVSARGGGDERFPEFPEQDSSLLNYPINK